MAEVKELIHLERKLLFGWAISFLVYRGLIKEVGFSINCYPWAKLKSWQGIYISVMLGWWMCKIELWKDKTFY